MRLWPGSPWAVIALLVGLVLLSTGRALGNGFAFDDVPIILENPQVHQLAPPWEYAQQSYWPPKNLGDAYRPWTVWWFAIQWGVSGGAPWAFHTVNLILIACLTLGVLILALELLPPLWAAAAAAVFAVHPVHVEATANVVGQGELWMALFSVAAATIYLRARRRDRPNGPERLALAALVVFAAASKEQGIVLPGLLLLLEWTVVPRVHPTPSTRPLYPTFLLLATVSLGFLAARYAVLGDLGGGPPAAGLAGLALGERLAVMGPLVFEWLRLLIWPASLLAQYSPPAQGGSASWSMPAVIGVAAVSASLVTLVAVRRRLPMLALGLGWIGIGLLPVSNIPFPTGVLVAERTLLLPSVGFTLLVGWWLSLVANRKPLSTVLLAALGVLVALGAARSWSRQVVWSDNLTLFRQTVIDEPRSYRGHFVLARELVRRGEPEEAMAAFAAAAQLFDRDVRIFEEWGQIHRAAGRCDLAVPVLERGILAEPTATIARGRLFECLLTLGRVDEAAGVAEEGLRLGLKEFESSLARAAKARSAPNPPRPTTR